MCGKILKSTIFLLEGWNKLCWPKKLWKVNYVLHVIQFNIKWALHFIFIAKSKQTKI